MIGYLKGTIATKDEKSLILLAGSVGYKVFPTSELLAEKNVGEMLELYIHTSVKENDISLYGFLSKESIHFFEKLLSVSGIGPKMALEILSSPIHLVQNAIIQNDIATLTKIKGLGKKTAERLVVELKNKVTPSYQKTDEKSISENQMNEEAIMALESLGYERFYVLKTLSKLPENIRGTEEIIKFVLKNN